MRLDDLVLDHPVPHVHLRFHEELGRTLKTRGSERKVPLVGIALWGAQRAVEAARSARSASGWLFPRYAADHNIRSTHAANTANKWLKRLLKDTKTTHSFRHAMRDRLRRVNAPEELADRVGGWGTRTVGMGYGEEDRLKQIKAHLEKIVLA